MFFGFELVGAEEFEPTGTLFSRKTLIVTLKKFEDIIDNNGLQVNFFLIIEVLRLQFNLWVGVDQKRCHRKQ